MPYLRIHTVSTIATISTQPFVEQQIIQRLYSWPAYVCAATS